MWGNLEIQFKKGCREEKAIPSLADGSSSEKGGWGEEGDDPIDQPLREPTPDPTVHPHAAHRICGPTADVHYCCIWKSIWKWNANSGVMIKSFHYGASIGFGLLWKVRRLRTTKVSTLELKRIKG
ncbi:unnamed protein product [Cuscuta epithymum]|uniref:Uncharacterized protein n=1 Tax=Cuscuta epithymum TaxID=186058 RepID=A0AAV0G141_9ASTE|nr:unnamed protein product [Cuscuta epithymum]CAH9141288.1 unnamed protein product [Cuscuta epithymum]